MRNTTRQQQTLDLPSYFAALRMVCFAFEVEMPEMQRTLDLMRSQEKSPNAHFPKKLNRVMLADAEVGNSRWTAGLAVVAERALHARMVLCDGRTSPTRTGIIARSIAFDCLELYRRLVPELKSDAVTPAEALWVLVEAVFIPTVFARLCMEWQRGLGHEFRPDSLWYLPVVAGGRQCPIQRVLRSWMRAAGFRTAQDFGKAMDDDNERRTVDDWLSGKHQPSIDKAHTLVERFSNEVAWLDSAADWKARMTLAVAMTNLCKVMDCYFANSGPESSLKIRQCLDALEKEGAPIDSRVTLNDPKDYFVARLVARRIKGESRTHTITPTCAATNASIGREAVGQEKAGNRDNKRTLDIVVKELNLLLKQKRVGRLNACRP